MLIIGGKRKENDYSRLLHSTLRFVLYKMLKLVPG